MWNFLFTSVIGRGMFRRLPSMGVMFLETRSCGVDTVQNTDSFVDLDSAKKIRYLALVKRDPRSEGGSLAGQVDMDRVRSHSPLRHFITLDAQALVGRISVTQR